MFTSLAAVNAIARFFVEIAAVAALGLTVGWLIAVAAVVAWALFAAPKARVQGSELLRLGTQVIVLGGAAAALVLSGAVLLGVVFGVVVAINSGLVALLPEPEWTAAA
jgi:hypothetical protein